MLDAIALARKGLKDHGNFARIAYALTATHKPVSAGGTVALKDRKQRIEYLEDALVLWQSLARSGDDRDNWPNTAWNRWVVKEFGGPEPLVIDEDVTRSERKKKIEQSRGPLQKVADKLANRDNGDLRALWVKQWRDRDAEWRQYLRWLRGWVLPRGSGKSDKTIRRVGGLGYDRQAAIRGLYQTLKAFSMRPEPDDLRRNVPAAGDESLTEFGQRILGTLERIRENRVKQLASRIVEAAIGAGTENRQHWIRRRKRPLARIDTPRHAACHAVVLENLEHYRPEQTRTRRENRGLMNWAARNVRKRLVEGCQLNGLHFEEVSASYTSREDSRTGVPGKRCEDLPIVNFIQGKNGEPPRIVKQSLKRILDEKGKGPDEPFERKVDRAQAMADRREGKARDRYILALYRKFRCEQADASLTRQAVRLPREGGEVFVPDDGRSPVSGGLQADLNAAANIGLRAMLDPDWSGAWWYVLVIAETHLPNLAKCVGSACACG